MIISFQLFSLNCIYYRRTVFLIQIFKFNHIQIDIIINAFLSENGLPSFTPSNDVSKVVNGKEQKGEEFSKNISPAPGADREGPTALVASINAIDTRDIPGDIILDMMIHPSTIQGEKGLMAMKVLIDRYFAAGGCAIHFNVFSAEELRDAQAHPERYENLQVRMCGWNVRWNDLSKTLQDAYILRAEGVLQP